MKEETSEKIKTIKQSFRLFMDGAVAQSMRNKGVNYHINWGIPVTRLKEMAAPYGKDYDLAIELWKENIRECKILATLIMPVEQMIPEVVDIWMEQTPSQELAEIACFNLYQHLDFAPMLAYKWMASNNEQEQLCGYLILTRLFMKGQEPNERGINEFLDQAYSAIQTDNMGLKRAIYNCLLRFTELDEEYLKMVQKAFKPLHIEF